MQQEDKNAIYQMRFPQKLWYLLNMHTDAILWGRTGRTILLNYRLLHTYLQRDHSIFKTTNISSFVRQLNLYGFRKVTSHLQDPLCNSCNPYMHEYVHDYFQYGRPELINKISRKALAMRKSFKPKSIYNIEDHLVYLSPLQKARRSLREALRKAAQNMFIQDSPRQSNEDLNFEWEDPQDELCDSEENIQLDWLLTKYYDKSKEQFPAPDLKGVSENKKKVIENDNNFGNNIQEENLITFKDTNEQTNENFSTPFLSMPDLEPEPNEEKTGIELLAEFNIGHDPDQSVIRDVNQNKEREQISLNCVLPSISNDDVSIEKDNETLNHYNGEWDQMFNDIMISKVNNQDSGSELKELYSQISRTIDLLND